VDYTVRPIAYIRNERSEALDDNWDEIVSTVELAQDVPEEAFGDWRSSRTWRSSSSPTGRGRAPGPCIDTARNAQWPDIGVFAQRNKDRPNRLLLSTVEIDELSERSFTVRGLTASTGRRYWTSSPFFAGACRRVNCAWHRGAKSSARTTSSSPQ